MKKKKKKKKPKPWKNVDVSKDKNLEEFAEENL